MADPHVLTGLISKRAEIAGQIEHTQDKLRQLVIDLGREPIKGCAATKSAAFGSSADAT